MPTIVKGCALRRLKTIAARAEERAFIDAIELARTAIHVKNICQRWQDTARWLSGFEISAFRKRFHSLHKVHPYSAGECPVCEGVSDVTPVVGQTPFDIEVYASARPGIRYRLQPRALSKL
jgi:hypothetical protein